MDIFLPDIYVKSVYAIDYKSLKNAGIKLVLFDLDNTLVPIDATEASIKLKGLMEEIKDIGLKPIILSNSGQKRVAPFKDGLFVDAACNSRKPLKRKYKKILGLYDVKPNEVACVGDQLLTDILGANRMKMTSILVNQISTRDFPWTRFNRFLERRIYDHFKSTGVLVKGEYYE